MIGGETEILEREIANWFACRGKGGASYLHQAYL